MRKYIIVTYTDSEKARKDYISRTNHYLWTLEKSFVIPIEANTLDSLKFIHYYNWKQMEHEMKVYTNAEDAEYDLTFTLSNGWTLDNAVVVFDDCVFSHVQLLYVHYYSKEVESNELFNDEDV